MPGVFIRSFMVYISGQHFIYGRMSNRFVLHDYAIGFAFEKRQSTVHLF